MSGLIYAQTANAAELCQLEGLFGNVLVYVLGFAGVVLFIYLLIGGFKYITSGGDPAQASAAKNTITYAIGGLVVIVLSFFVINLIATFTGAGTNITNFTIYRGTETCPDWPN